MDNGIKERERGDGKLNNCSNNRHIYRLHDIYRCAKEIIDILNQIQINNKIYLLDCKKIQKKR